MLKCSELANKEHGITLSCGGPRRYNGNMVIRATKEEAEFMAKFSTQDSICETFSNILKGEMTSLPCDVEMGSKTLRAVCVIVWPEDTDA